MQAALVPVFKQRGQLEAPDRAPWLMTLFYCMGVFGQRNNIRKPLRIRSGEVEQQKVVRGMVDAPSMGGYDTMHVVSVIQDFQLKKKKSEIQDA